MNNEFDVSSSTYITKQINKCLKNNDWNSQKIAFDLLKIFLPSCFYFTEIQTTNDTINRKIIEFSKTFIAGKDGDFNQFKAKLKPYDFSVICGFPWTEIGFGYRCRTCGLSSNTVFCVPCFKNGNHDGHDFNKFKCDIGGTCDCGNSDAMKETGFCCNHGPAILQQQKEPPQSLIGRLKLLMPMYLKCFVFAAWTFLRNVEEDSSPISPSYMSSVNILMSVLAFVNELYLDGWVTQKVIAEIMIDKELFTNFVTELRNFDQYILYEQEVQTKIDFTFPINKVGSQQLHHETLLDMFIFLTIKLSFQENMVSFLNGPLTINAYKEAYIASLMNHYSRIAFQVIALSGTMHTDQAIVNSVVSGSDNLFAQILSFELISLNLVKSRNIQYLIVHCLMNMFLTTLTVSETYDTLILDSEHVITKSCSTWTFIHNLITIVTFKSIVKMIIADEQFMTDWITILKWMQFMNPYMVHQYQNDANTSVYCTDLEIRLGITLAWNFWYHCRSKDDKEMATTLAQFFVSSLADFLNDLPAVNAPITSRRPLSFFLPLMRNTSYFVLLALLYHDVEVSVILESISVKQMIRWFEETANVLLGYQEVMVGYWSRCGEGVKKSIFIYCHSVFCWGLIDMDILSAQICASVIPSSEVIYMLTDPTQLLWGIELNHCQYPVANNHPQLKKAQSLAFEAWLTNLCWLLDLRNDMEIDEDAQLRKEVCRQLTINPLKRSDVEFHQPKRFYFEIHQATEIDPILREIANFTEPNFDEYSKNMQSGLYALKPELWDTDYDPLFQSLRSETKQSAVAALSKYREYYRRKENLTQPNTLWPPYRDPPPLKGELSRLEKILHCKDLAYVLFCSLNMFINNDPLVSEDSLALIVHLIQRSVLIGAPYHDLDFANDLHRTRFPENPYMVDDMRINICLNIDLRSPAKTTDGDDKADEEVTSSNTATVRYESILSLLVKIHSKLHLIRVQTGGKSASSSKSTKWFKNRLNAMKAAENSSDTDSKSEDKFDTESDVDVINNDPLSLKYYKNYPLVYQYSRDNLEMANDTGLGIRWGDGVDYIGHVLDIIASKGGDGYKYLINLIEEIKERDVEEIIDDFPSVSEDKRKASFRRRKILSNMKMKQNASATVYRMDSLNASVTDSEIYEKYDCVICQLKTDTRTDKMVLLGVLCSASAIRYMHEEPRNGTVVCRKDYLSKVFFDAPIVCSSVLIQTCGHVVHQNCLDKFMAHKYVAAVVNCPMCRRDIHHVTPIYTNQNTLSSSESFYSIIKHRLLDSLHTKPRGDIQTDIINGGTHVNISCEQQACSLLRSQLEVELITCLSSPDQYSTVTKRSKWPEFVCYLRSLNANAMNLIRQCDRIFSTSIHDDVAHGKDSLSRQVLFTVPSDVFLNFIPYVWPHEDQLQYILEACIVMTYVKSMTMICCTMSQSEYDRWSNVKVNEDNFLRQFSAVVKKCRPIHHDVSFGNLLKKAFYDLRTRVKGVPDIERPDSKGPIPVVIYRGESSGGSTASLDEGQGSNKGVTYDAIVLCITQSIVPLLRMAAVLRLRLLKVTEIPDDFPISVTGTKQTPDYTEQFLRLCHYLNLPQRKNPSESCSEHLANVILKCLHSTLYTNFSQAVNAYVNQDFIDSYLSKTKRTKMGDKSLNILTMGQELYPPQLIDLANNYEDLFNAYQSHRCKNADHDFRGNGLCLLCGHLICYAPQGLPREFNGHSRICCTDTGIVLDVNTSIVYVFVKDEGIEWGSVYLDSYGEEDLELKRGRPLFLNGHRLKLLEQQWLTHSFKHVLKKWTRIL